MNFKVNANDTEAKPLGTDENADGIITPVNLGPHSVWTLHVPQGDPPTAADVVDLGAPTAPGEQLQLGSGQSTRNLTKYFAACATGESAEVRGIY